jgi:hypothetical protein
MVTHINFILLFHGVQDEGFMGLPGELDVFIMEMPWLLRRSQARSARCSSVSSAAIAVAVERLLQVTDNVLTACADLRYKHRRADFAALYDTILSIQH